ncbi:unnamed protein product [Eruca vesicaria subsp. sativa]|uniref:Uncharacterized protein n=1 Tax=Eruca vesicaria subsp. sativa TaxID=29727 RepID=A0ABC8KBE6_ERUVS|nr:unnamed protein product [Eruca vesicaria subsp. sativa]
MQGNRGLGLSAHVIDHCNLILKFPQGTNNTWYNKQFKIFEPLDFKYNVCEALLLWEQVRTLLRGVDKCYNRTLCEEHLNVILPAKPPFHPRQFHKCDVVGNSGDLLKTEFGKEIDSHVAVFRDNEAPVNKNYGKYVGVKRDF